jgi:HTH-type transcriptional regulator / antitoxin MqsA
MASAVQTLPDAMVSQKTGEVLRRDVRPFIVIKKGRSETVDLPGYYPAKGDDAVHVGDDMNVTDIALRALKEDVEGIPAPAAIKCVSQ